MIRETVRTTVRGVGVLAMTAVEVTALSVWLGLAGDAPALSAATAVGAAALAAGLLLEVLAVHLVVNGRGRPVAPFAVAALAATETGVWVGWLASVTMAERPLAVLGAGLALAVALVPRHAVADNVVRGRRPLSSLVGRVPAGLGVIEAAGATAWVLVVSGTVAIPEWFRPVPVAGFSPEAVVGAALLAGALFVQHVLAVRYALRTARDVERVDLPSSWRAPPE